MMGRGLAVLIALGEGALVGTALVAFLTVLDVIPRVAQATRTTRQVSLYEHAVWIGALVGSLTDVLPAVHLPVFATALFGLVMGIFTGLFTAALAEVMNVIPVFGRRFNMERAIVLLVIALVLGKTVGSLLYWVLPELRP